jgi:hypothetical protein
VKVTAARRALSGTLTRISRLVPYARPEAAPVADWLASSPAGSAVRAMVQAAPATLTPVRHRAQPIAASIARLSITATCAYSLRRLLPIGARSVLAPLTALIVVQVTMYQTIRSALQRVVSVIARVLAALAFSFVIDLTWWSLAILIAPAWPSAMRCDWVSTCSRCRSAPCSSCRWTRGRLRSSG